VGFLDKLLGKPTLQTVTASLAKELRARGEMDLVVNTACLRERNIETMARCIALDMDCAAICRLVSGFMSRGSEFSRELCRLCADVCQACGEECGKHPMDHCQVCATVCRRCAAECRKMAA